MQYTFCNCDENDYYMKNINEGENDGQNRYVRISILDNDFVWFWSKMRMMKFPNIKDAINYTQGQHDVSLMPVWLFQVSKSQFLIK